MAAPTAVLKKAVKRRSIASSHASAPPATGATASSDANARQVTRAEFQELSSAVAQLKKDLARHQCIGVPVSQLESELQLSSAQVGANKNAMGTLADLVLEKTDELQQHVANQLQSLHVESNQRLNDVQLVLERLEFRFKHHVRDCQTIAEQTDLHQEALQNLRSQLGQTQNLLDAHQEEQKRFVDTVQYSVATAESKAAAAVNDCTQRLESFQQRMVAYVKRIDDDTLDDMVSLRQSLGEISALKASVQHQREQCDHLHAGAAARALSAEKKVDKVLSLLEKCVERAEVDRVLGRLESNVKTRLEAVQELIALCIESVASSSTTRR
ncbi:hypothetical protein PybrP1_003122 [[Pythium] brassicae (nom. inval.)]|nr:hypothetical protein PybrP1_003122 [[Pythium] brassicae (nom. inval.)]